MEANFWRNLLKLKFTSKQLILHIDLHILGHEIRSHFFVQNMETNVWRNLLNKSLLLNNWLLLVASTGLTGSTGLTTITTYAYAVRSYHVFSPQMVFQKRMPQIDGLYLNVLQM